MRMSLSVNGTTRMTASLPAAGFLSAHLNLSDRPKEGTATRKVRLAAFDTSDDTETVSLEWPTINLDIGDVVELRILSDGDGDAPSKTGRSSEAPSNLFSNSGLAGDLMRAVGDFETRAIDILSRSRSLEPPEEYQKLRQAIPGVLSEIASRLLYPIYRRHKELVPDSHKGELL